MIKNVLLLLLTVPCFLFSSAQPKAIGPCFNPESLVDAFRERIETGYAPQGWKSETFGWDLDVEVKKVKAALRSCETVPEMSTAFAGFFNGMRDYHVRIIFADDDSYSYLPLMAKTVNGKTFITHVFREIVTEDECPVQVGDQLLTFDGKPVAEVLKEITEISTPNSNPATDGSFADTTLLLRIGAFGHPTKEGKVSLTYLSKDSNETESLELEWEHSACKLPYFGSKKSGILSSCPLFNRNSMNHQMTSNWAVVDPRKKMMGGTPLPNSIGSQHSLLPSLGEILWEERDSQHFQAYIYRHPSGKKVGFLRIPTFWFEEETAAEEAFALIDKMEQNADCLVIDQMNNGGGNAFFLYSLLSKLVTETTQAPRHRFVIDYELITTARQFEEYLSDERNVTDLLEELSSYGYADENVMLDNIQNWVAFVKEEWERGHSLSDPFYLYIGDSIQPNPKGGFTKPLLVLINELDFSCADFFPAILQDCGRATLMGSRTSGAGGYVTGQAIGTQMGTIGFTLTGSIAERPSGEPIENLGVMPDIEYQLTEQDLQEGYRPFAEAVNQAVEQLLK